MGGTLVVSGNTESVFFFSLFFLFLKNKFIENRGTDKIPRLHHTLENYITY